MSLFIIILIIYLIAHASRNLNIIAEQNAYIRRTTTNAKEQYDYCCSQIENFAREYRHEAAKIEIETYFRKNKMNEMESIFHNTKQSWNIDYEHDIKYDCFNLNDSEKFRNFESLIKDKKEFEAQISVPKYDIEKIWVTFTAMACGINLNTNYMSYIYENDVWDKIPLTDSDMDLNKWRLSYPNAPKDLALLKHYLNISIFYKKYILKNIMFWDTDFCEDANSYEVYDNQIILNKIALKHNLPSIDQLKMGWDSTYENISTIALFDSKRYIKNKNFMPVDLINITPHPTKRDREKNYSIKSLRELRDADTSYDIRKKNPYL